MTVEKLESEEDQIYRDLQIHINNQAIAYPELKSGAEIRVLKHLFDPEEAKTALYLTYKFESIDQIFERAKESGISKNDLETILERMVMKGIIGQKEKDGMNYYQSWGLAIGFYEGQVHRLTPEFIKDLQDVMDDPTFGLEFLNNTPAQWRTIPIEKSVTPKHKVSTYDELEKLIMNSEGPFCILECICRQKKHLQGEPCKVTSRLETCLGFGDLAALGIKRKIGRAASKEEALETLRKNQEEGLVLNSSNSQKAEFICSCCGCCCGMLHAHHILPDPSIFWINNFYAEIDSDLCIGCQTCVPRCQANAIKFKKSKNLSIVNLKKCIGCGNCVAVCPEEAIQLIKKENESVPPETFEDLLDTMKSNR